MVENTNDLQRMIGRTEQKHRLDAALQASQMAPGAQSNEKVFHFFSSCQSEVTSAEQYTDTLAVHFVNV